MKRSTGARAGRVLSREIRRSRAPTPLSEAEGQTLVAESARRRAALRGRRPRARTEPFCARTGRSPGRPARWHAGPCREGHELQVDDERPGEVRSPNKAGAQSAAEVGRQAVRDVLRRLLVRLTKFAIAATQRRVARKRPSRLRRDLPVHDTHLLRAHGRAHRARGYIHRCEPRCGTGHAAIL
jgi:hypothetical protein